MRPNSMTTTTNMVAASRAAATANTGLLNPCRPQSPCRLLRSNMGARLPAFTQLPTAETVRTDGNAELPVSATTGTPGVSELRWQCGGTLDAPQQPPHTPPPPPPPPPTHRPPTPPTRSAQLYSEFPSSGTPGPNVVDTAPF